MLDFLDLHKLLSYQDDTLSVVVWAIFIGAVIAVILINYRRSVYGALVRALFNAGAHSPAEAKTLAELGLDRKRLLLLSLRHSRATDVVYAVAPGETAEKTEEADSMQTSVSPADSGQTEAGSASPAPGETVGETAGETAEEPADEYAPIPDPAPDSSAPEFSGRPSKEMLLRLRYFIPHGECRRAESMYDKGRAGIGTTLLCCAMLLAAALLVLFLVPELMQMIRNFSDHYFN